jgi:hypothetical protein
VLVGYQKQAPVGGVVDLRIAEDDATNATEAVDTDLDDHCDVSMGRVKRKVCGGRKGLRWMEGN